MKNLLTAPVVFALLIPTLVSGEPQEGKEEGPDGEKAKVQKMHQHFSSSCFNQCWAVIEKAEHSPTDVEEMLLLSYASLWHWTQRNDCKPLNLSIGYWQASRAHSLSGQYEMARLFGEKCVKTSLEGKLSAFFLGYGYEALARAEVVHGDLAKAKAHLEKAQQELGKVTEEMNREFLSKDLADLRKAIESKPDTDGGQ